MERNKWIGIPVIRRMIKEEQRNWLKDGKDGNYDVTLAISALKQLEWRIEDEARRYRGLCQLRGC